MQRQSYEQTGGLMKALSQAGHLLEVRLDAALDGLGLSIAKLAVLQHLVQAGESLPLGQLAERLACVKSNVTHLIDRLEADGLVRRIADPEDRRSIRAVITEDGRRRYEAGARVEAEVERELFGGLTPQEREALLVLLERFRRAAEPK